MPRGMYLKSQGFASSLSDPDGRVHAGRVLPVVRPPYADYGLPVPLDTFVAYGEWFQQAAGPGRDRGHGHRPGPAAGGYQLSLADGETVTARQVVLAIGVEHFAYLPGELAGLPAAGVHAQLGAHRPGRRSRGQRVLVVGAGQSALESAALLHESGADVRIVMRKQQVVWNGAPLAPDRPLRQRLREPEAGLGSGWSTWFYSRQPGLFRHLPESTRIYRARTALGPAGASWLRGRVEGEFPILAGHALAGADGRAGRGPAGLVTDGAGQRTELAADHVIAATGYRPDLGRLPFLGPGAAAPGCAPWPAPRRWTATTSPASPGCTWSGPASRRRSAR